MNEREALTFELRFVLDEIDRDVRQGIGPGLRCLILNSTPATHGRGDVVVKLACSDGYFPYDRTRQTFLASMLTCPQCAVVQAARVAMLDADEPGRPQ